MRSKAASLPLGGVLCQIKADWKCMKEVLKLPGWQDEEICFLCHIRKTQVSGTSEKGTRGTRSTPLSEGTCSEAALTGCIVDSEGIGGPPPATIFIFFACALFISSLS